MSIGGRGTEHWFVGRGVLGRWRFGSVCQISETAGRQRVSKSAKRHLVQRFRASKSPAQTKTQGMEDAPSSRGVVCWSWSSGPLMLSKHKGYLVTIRQEVRTATKTATITRTIVCVLGSLISLVSSAAAVLSPRRGSEDIQRLPHSERGCDSRRKGIFSVRGASRTDDMKAAEAFCSQVGVAWYLTL